MPILQCYVDDQDFATLERVSRETGRTVENLAEASISNECCQVRVRSLANTEGET